MLDNTKWNLEIITFSGTSSEEIKKIGDTILLSKVYQIYKSPYYTHILREDTLQKKVYEWDSNINKEVVLFDFSLKVNDRFKNGNVEYYVREIKEIDVVGGKRKQFWIMESNNFSWEYWIEGVGNIHYPLWDFTISGDPVINVLCTYQNNEMVYNKGLAINGKISDCIPANRWKYYYDCDQDTFQFNGFTIFPAQYSEWIIIKNGQDSTFETTINHQIRVQLSPGTYEIIFIPSNGNKTDTVSNYLTVPEKIKDILQPDFLGADVALCDSMSIGYTIQAPKGFDKYLWSDSSSADSLFVTKSGTYALTVYNSLGCSMSDTINVKLDGFPKIFFVYQVDNTDTIRSNVQADIYNWFKNDTLMPNEHQSWLIVDLNEKAYYNLEAKTFTGCRKFSSYIEIDPSSNNTSIRIEEAKQFNIYPNPFSSEIIIENFGSVSYEATIYNSTGESIFKSDSQNNLLKINTEKWVEGIYIIEVRTSNSTRLFKITK